ncbi:hypothetical protein CrLKS4_g57 [Cylindrospermopsis phage Cr-LKS4]|jgi:hypothetical protein|nr:hypothetical protein CrLKS4_g57 [Cylindrospermopsis phage Cr-LKS4]
MKNKLLKLLDTLIDLEYSSLSNKTRDTMFTSNIITSSASSAINPVESGSNPPVIKDAVRRVLENFEILYKTKFADLVLVSWVDILNKIPDADLIATGIRVAQTHKYLPTPNEFLEVYREGLRVKRDAERMAARQEILGNGDGVVKPLLKTEESEKEYYIFRLAIALEYCNQLGDDGKKVHWKDYDMERLEIESKAFYASMRNMPLAELMDLNMQVRMPDKKGLVNNISHLLNRDL